MRLPNINNVEKCKHCWSNFWFYQNVFVSWWTTDCTLFNWEKENTEMNDKLWDWKYYPTCYCVQCYKPIGTLKKGEHYFNFK